MPDHVLTFPDKSKLIGEIKFDAKQEYILEANGTYYSPNRPPANKKMVFSPPLLVSTVSLAPIKFLRHVKQPPIETEGAVLRFFQKPIIEACPMSWSLLKESIPRLPEALERHLRENDIICGNRQSRRDWHHFFLYKVIQELQTFPKVRLDELIFHNLTELSEIEALYFSNDAPKYPMSVKYPFIKLAKLYARALLFVLEKKTITAPMFESRIEECQIPDNICNRIVRLSANSKTDQQITHEMLNTFLFLLVIDKCPFGLVTHSYSPAEMHQIINSMRDTLSVFKQGTEWSLYLDETADAIIDRIFSANLALEKCATAVVRLVLA